MITRNLKNQKAYQDLIFNSTRVKLESLPLIDSHLHTSWTDGEPSVKEVYLRACEIGLDAILYSEHCRKTSNDWFGNFAKEVRSVEHMGCHAYVGAECKVENYNGDIDISLEIENQCDLIMASVHRFPDHSGGSIPFGDVSQLDAIQHEFDLSWKVLANPKVDILGHIFGMCYKRYSTPPPNEKIEALVRRAAEFNVAIEINSHYHHDRKKLLSICQSYGALVTFGSNAHDLHSIGKSIEFDK